MVEKLTLEMAVDILGIPADTSKRSVNIPCPVCAKGREKKLNINFEKGLFRCNKCELSGGPLNLWAVYRGLPIPTSKEEVQKVSHDYFLYMGQEKKSGKSPRKKAHKTFEKIDQDIAPIEVRNRTYKGLLGLLDLSKEHKDNLLRRGLSEERILINEYRTYPYTGRTEIASLLLENGYILNGVPGFYKLKTGAWTMRKMPSGFLIPQRDGFGRIQGFQVRADKPLDDMPKYLTLSTAEMLSGAKGGTYPHLAKGERGLREIIVTEGPLKGDIISEITGYSVLCLTGVNALEKAEKPLFDLKEAGMEKVLIAYDMDLKKNQNVRRALENLKTILAKQEICFNTLDWDEAYKGLDDYLVSKK